MAKVGEKAVKQNRDERNGMKGIGMKLFRKKKVRGAVSIFLVIILLPVMLLSAVLIDGSRYDTGSCRFGCRQCAGIL